MPPSDAPGQEEPPAGQAAKAARLPPSETALQHRALAALVVALLGLAGFLGFNVDLHRGILIVGYALLAGVTALWLALTAMRRARRNRTARPRGSVAAVTIASIGIALSLMMLLAFALFGQQLTGYGQCLSGANTIAAQQACYSQLTHALDSQLNLLNSSAHG
jgi:hypothetical protein